MPWPDRIYEGLFLNPASGERERISRDYSTQMQVMIDALGRMPVSNKVPVRRYLRADVQFADVPAGRRARGYDDPQFSNFYGQTFPLVKRGVPVKTIHLKCGLS